MLLTSAFTAGIWAQPGELKTATAVLERYQQALGGAVSISRIQSETRHGEVEGSGIQGKITFTSYNKPFKWLAKIHMPDGTERVNGFDGAVSWSTGPKGAEIDTSIPVESNRRDSDLHYALHQPDYFQKLELAGVTDFEGHRCYWLHGATHWGKDNNQFYDINTGLLVGYRFQSDDKSSVPTIAVFDDYRKFDGHLVATKNIARSGDQQQTTIFTEVSFEPIPDSVFDLPAAVKALLK
ncbi:MAG TPA: hypothetical protein VML19_28315 [Verrucomicrobiae bacterium]|nr:hypothetical protein [Verrucomicrobiae bacterium]